VREVFERAARGDGIDGIAKDFNRRGEPTWGRGRRRANHWRGSYIRKILASSAPVGTFTSHTSTRDDRTRARRDIPMQGVEGLFPAVIDKETYGRATRRMSTTRPRGRHATAELKSLLAGVLKCKACGSSAVRVSNGGYTYLVCSRANARAHGCPYQAIRQDAFEGWLAERMPDIIHDAPRGKSTVTLDRQIAKLQAAADQMEAETVRLARLTAGEPSVAAKKALRASEKQLHETQAALRTLRSQRDNLTTASVADRLQTLQKTMAKKPRNVRETNDALKQAIQRIDMDLPRGAMEIHWHHGDEPQELPYPNRHMDWNREPSWEQ